MEFLGLLDKVEKELEIWNLETHTSYICISPSYAQGRILEYGILEKTSRELGSSIRLCSQSAV